MAPRMYTKLANSADGAGTLYEILVALLVFLRLKNHKDVKQFALATNHYRSDKYDDLVFSYGTAPSQSTNNCTCPITSTSTCPSTSTSNSTSTNNCTCPSTSTNIVWKSCFVQLKHKKACKLDMNQLFAGATNDFSLLKYLKSFKKVKENISVYNNEDILMKGPIETSEFALFTNALLDESLVVNEINLDSNICKGTNASLRFENLLKSGNEGGVIFNMTEVNYQCYLISKLIKEKMTRIQERLVPKLNEVGKSKVSHLTQEKPNRDIKNQGQYLNKEEQTIFDNIVSKKRKLKQGRSDIKFTEAEKMEFKSLCAKKSKKVLNKGCNDSFDELKRQYLDQKRFIDSLSDYLNEKDKGLVTEFQKEYDGLVDLIPSFFDKLTIFSGQSHVNQLDKIIKSELKLLYLALSNTELDRLFDICKARFQVWCNNETSGNEKQVFNEVLDEESNILNDCHAQLKFETNSFLQCDPYRLKNLNFTKDALSKLNDEFLGHQFIHVSTNTESLQTTTTKVHQMMTLFNKFPMYSTVENLTQNQDYLNHCPNDTIVLVSDSIHSNENLETFVTKITNLLNEYKNKQIVFISEINSPLSSNIESQIPSYYKLVHDSFSIIEYDDNTKEYVGNINIRFQDHDVPLISLFENNKEKLNAFLTDNPNLAASLVSGDMKPVIGHTLPTELPCFIPRSLRTRNVVSSQILTSSESTDVFLVTGMSVNKLGDFISDYKFVESEVKDLKSELRHLQFHKLIQTDDSKSKLQSRLPLFLIIEYGDATTQFSALCESYSNVHWLHVARQDQLGSEQLLWKRSKAKGDVSDVITWRSNTETFIEQNSLITSDSKIEIVIGVGGMGKTTLVGNVASEAKIARPQDWVVLVKLRQHSDNIGKGMKGIDFLTTVGLSGQPSQLETKLFECALNDIGNVIVICDGLDEICPQYEKQVFKLLEQIQGTKVKKLIISSRYSLQNTLETKFAVPSNEIVQFSKENLTTYLTKNDVHLSIESMSNVESLLSTPLLAMLYVDATRDSADDSQQSLEIFNLFDLVKLFIKKQYKRYYEKFPVRKSEDEIKKMFFISHYIVALKVFHSDEILGDQFKKKFKEILEDLESFGIVSLDTIGNPQFLHQTFSEYFTAYGLIEYRDNIEFRDKVEINDKVELGDEIPDLLQGMLRNIEGLRYMINNMLSNRELDVTLNKRLTTLLIAENNNHLDDISLKHINFTQAAVDNLHESLKGSESLTHVSTTCHALKITTTKIYQMFKTFPKSTIYSTVGYFVENQGLFKHWIKLTYDTIVIVNNDKNNTQAELKNFIAKIEKVLDQLLFKNKQIILVSEGNDTLITNLLKLQIPSCKTFEEFYSYHDLDDQSKEYLLNIRIPFQNGALTLKTYFDKNTYNELIELFSCSPNLVESLILEQVKTIGQALPTEMARFIPRSLRMRCFVEQSIFTSYNTTDVLLVAGIKNEFSENLVSFYNFIDHKNEALLRKFNNTKFYKPKTSETPLLILMQDEDATQLFNLLCLSYSTIHWLHWVTGTEYMVWKRSQGDISDIKRCLGSKESIQKQNCLLNYDLKVDLVIGEAGMGKTTLMECIACKTKKANSLDWVVYVDLRKNSFLICNETDAVSFLTAVGLSGQPSQLEKLLFKCALNDIGNVIVICDGFDEVCPQYEEEALTLMLQIQKTNVKKLIISSRYSLQNSLETRLATISKEVVGFSEYDFVLFLNKSGIQTTITTTIQSMMNTNEKSFLISTPLLSMMVAEVFKELPENSFPHRQENFNLFYLVELCVEKKFKIYFEKRKTELSLKNVKEYFFKNHFFAALKIFISDADFRNVFKDHLETSLQGLESGGIIQSVTGQNKPSFIHNVFAEYFVAYGLLEYADNVPLFLQKNMFKNIDGLPYMINNMTAKDSELHRAVLDQNINKVEELLSTKQYNVDAIDKTGRQLIHFAASFGIETQNENQERFIGPRNRHIIETLLNNGADVNSKDRLFSWTPLKFALVTASFYAAEYLLVNEASKEHCKIPIKLLNNQVLCTAINNGFVHVFKLILAQMKLEDDSVLRAAVQYGNQDIVDATLSKTRNIKIYNTDGRPTTIRHLAAEYNHFNLFKNLCKIGKVKNKFEETDELGRTYLHAACEGGALRMTEYFLEQGADINRQDEVGNTPLHLASWHGMTVVAGLLIDHHADIDRQNKEGNGPLHLASLRDMAAVARLLIEHHVDIDRQNKEGWNPLHFASWRGMAEVVRLLIEHHADINRQNKEGDTPLHIASLYGMTDVAGLLIDHHADIDRRNKWGNTPLHLASLHGMTAVAGLLIEHHADINRRNKVGDTPLHLASWQGMAVVVGVLVEHHADINRQNEGGDTPLDYATWQGKTDVINILKSHSAQLGRATCNLV